MTIAQAQQLIDTWIRKDGVPYFSELTNMAILTEEVGEVARLMARIYGDQSFRPEALQEDPHAMLADELADLLWVVIAIANQTGVDLTTALAENINKKSHRDKSRHRNNNKLK